MFSVMNRSEESWGPLAKVDDKSFNKLINLIDAKTKIKDHLKKQKKMKTYKVTFIKQLVSDQFEIQAESDWDVGSKAREFFKENKETIEFKPKAKSDWDLKNGTAVDYDQMQYSKVR